MKIEGRCRFESDPGQYQFLFALLFGFMQNGACHGPESSRTISARSYTIFLTRKSNVSQELIGDT